MSVTVIQHALLRRIQKHPTDDYSRVNFDTLLQLERKDYIKIDWIAVGDKGKLPTLRPIPTVLKAPKPRTPDLIILHVSSYSSRTAGTTYAGRVIETLTAFDIQCSNADGFGKSLPAKCYNIKAGADNAKLFTMHKKDWMLVKLAMDMTKIETWHPDNIFTVEEL